MHRLAHTYSASLTHTYTPEVPGSQVLKYSLWRVAGTFSITLHILSEGSRGVCAYSCNRHMSPDTQALVLVLQLRHIPM